MPKVGDSTRCERVSPDLRCFRVKTLCETCREGCKNGSRIGEAGYNRWAEPADTIRPTMLVAAVYALARIVLDLISILGRDQAADRAELLALRQQVRVLDRQIKRVHWQPADRLILASLLSRAPTDALAGWLVRPATVIGWQRELVRRKWRAFGRRPRRGRPPIADEVRDLIVRMGSENPTWGYVRIRGELMKLGHRVAAGTIKAYLRRSRVPPAPRRSGPSWRRFLRAHAQTIVATDFLTVDTVFLKRIYILFFLHLASRRIVFAACTQHPDAAWVTQQARNAAWELSELGVEARYLVRDRDSKYSEGFDAATGADVLRTPFQTPVANAFAERWVGSLRRECLDWMLILNQRHLERVLRVYVEHYNLARPHRPLNCGRRLGG